MGPPRSRIRTLLALVLACALAMSAVAALQRRARRYERLAAYHRSQARAFGISDLDWFLLLTWPKGGSTDWWRAEFESESDYALVRSTARYVTQEHDAADRFENAARQPWTSPHVVFTEPRPPMERTRAVLKKALAKCNAAAR